MTSGPIVVSVLESEMRYSVIAICLAPQSTRTRWRVRCADYADSLTENGTHGSSSLESAQREIAFSAGWREGEVCPPHPLISFRLSRCKCVGDKLSVPKILFLLMPRAVRGITYARICTMRPGRARQSLPGRFFSALRGAATM